MIKNKIIFGTGRTPSRDFTHNIMLCIIITRYCVHTVVSNVIPHELPTELPGPHAATDANRNVFGDLRNNNKTDAQSSLREQYYMYVLCNRVLSAPVP